MENAPRRRGRGSTREPNGRTGSAAAAPRSSRLSNSGEALGGGALPSAIALTIRLDAASIDLTKSSWAASSRAALSAYHPPAAIGSLAVGSGSGGARVGAAVGAASSAACVASTAGALLLGRRLLLSVLQHGL